VWGKESFLLRHNNYHSQFELVYFGWKGKGGDPKFWFGDRKQSDLWEIHRDPNYIHPTQKPVELYARALRNSCPTDGLCYEPFAGSGTALIAAEAEGRRCYALELDPGWAQAILDRWEGYTGQTAQKVDGGA
jgi:DNA modification methylase